MRCSTNQSANINKSKRGRPPHSNQMLKQIHTGRVMGFSIQDIAKVLCISMSSVWKYTQAISHTNRPNRSVTINRRTGLAIKKTIKFAKFKIHKAACRAKPKKK